MLNTIQSMYFQVRLGLTSGHGKEGKNMSIAALYQYAIQLDIQITKIKNC